MCCTTQASALYASLKCQNMGLMVQEGHRVPESEFIIVSLC